MTARNRRNASKVRRRPAKAPAKAVAAKKAAPRTPRKSKPRATANRVAVLEVLERSGGNIKDAVNGVCPRIARQGGTALPHSSTVHQTLRGLEEEGMVVLDEVPTNRGTPGAMTIVEAQLVEIPENFRRPIKKLRQERGIRWFYEDERRGNDAVTSRALEVSVEKSEAERIVSDLLNGVDLPGEREDDEPVISELLERIAELEAERDVLKIQVAALIQYVQQNKTEVQL